MQNNLFDRALKVIPGGVNSPVRSFRGVGKQPVFISHGKGSWLFGADGKKYIDYIGAWGPMIFGHAWPPLVEALQKQTELSTTIGLATEKEIELAELVVSMVPGIEKVRLVNSGTEACMTALRIARGVTGKQKLIKFQGCYHGHADPFLVEAGSGALTLGTPSSHGLASETVQNTLVAQYNNISSVETLLQEYDGEIAAIIIEPVAGNMGCIPPSVDFLKALRALATKHGVCLIFDEVMTGFRLAQGGGQELYSVEADLVTFGKIIGGGIPVGAVAGKNRWMDCLAPLGQVYQAGTLSGNPLATTAGITMLTELKNNASVYQYLDSVGKLLENGLTEVFSKAGFPVRINRVGSMISIFFTENVVETFTDVQNSDMNLFAAFFHEMLENGVHLPPSGYESWFLSTTHTDNLIDFTISAAEKSIQKIKIKQTYHG